MSETPKSETMASGHAKVDAAYHTAEWLLTAFASTLVFIVFIMQVYRIPTGSMAETLRGAHFRLRCEQCGYRYDHDFIHQHYQLPNTVTPSAPLPIGPRSPHCPSCGFAQPDPIKSNGRYFVKQDGQFVPAPRHTVFKGDQIFVQKCIYQFFEPKRWDVIVFKNPTEPRINYIKRCIGLPGETVQLIDGDVFVDGRIQRKPDKVQEELWMVLYDNDHQPMDPTLPRYNGHPWQQPFQKVGTSGWNLNADGPRVFALDAADETVHRIQYVDKYGFRATYAYDDPGYFSRMPVCSDLMVRYYAAFHDGAAAGAQIRKYGITYQGWVTADGAMTLSRLTPGGQPVRLAEGTCNPGDLPPAELRFATVDHQLVLRCGSAALTVDLGTGVDDAGTDRHIPPEVQILGRGKLRLTHVAVFRDIHYLSDNIRQGSADNPMVLGDDQYYACGDNSPASLDSRLWDSPGLGNNGHTYPTGVVPKEYLVGKAMVVHWPGGFRFKNEPIRWIPYMDGFKVIYGGKEPLQP